MYLKQSTMILKYQKMSLKLGISSRYPKIIYKTAINKGEHAASYMDHYTVGKKKRML